MTEKHIRINSEKQMHSFASDIAQTLLGGEVLLLSGDLGSGKTTFTAGLAAALGVQDTVTSPTFALMNVYNAKNGLSLVHIDTYRLKDAHELEDIGVTEYIGQPKTITVIEWPEKIRGLLPETKKILLSFSHGDVENERVITVH